MAHDEVAQILALLTVVDQESLTSLASKLHASNGFSKDSTVVYANSFFHKMNETLPDDKKIASQTYVTAREVTENKENMDTAHPIGRIFVRSAQNLHDAANIMFDVIVKYKVESFGDIPVEVTNLVLAKHALFKACLEQITDISPTVAVMASLSKILDLKNSMLHLALGEVYTSCPLASAFMLISVWNRSTTSWRTSFWTPAASSTRAFVMSTSRTSARIFVNRSSRSWRRTRLF